MFILNEDQLNHVFDIKKKFVKNKVVIDTSIMGTGKSITGLTIAEEYDTLLIIGPPGLEDVWKNFALYFNVNVIFISYKLLTGFTGREINNDLLIRNNDDFLPSKNLINIVNNKCLVIIDEFQEIKNAKLTFLACKCVVKSVIESNNSRCLLLSGTPYDKKEHIIHILQLIGLMDENNYDELIKYCVKINEKDTTILQYSQKKNPEEVIYKLYISIIQHEIVSSMIPPKINSKIECFNGYFHMSDQGIMELKRGIKLLHNSVDKTKTDSITTSMRVIQNSKVEIFVRLSKIILNNYPNDKLTLFFDFDEPIYRSFNELREYNPKIVNGKVSYQERTIYINKFMENNNESRLLIFNTAVGSTGISLDDTTGNHKRWCLACPNYYIMRMHQLTRRFYRVSTKSDPTIIYVYGICGTEETSVINSLNTKSEVMKETLSLQVDSGIIFPSDYEKFEERVLSFDKLDMNKIKNAENMILKSQNKNLGNVTLKLNLKTEQFHKQNVRNFMDMF